MSPSFDDNQGIASRLALEALRSGVPNRAAVRLLGCNQPRVEGRFTEMLEMVSQVDSPTKGAQGMLVSGDFGSGKSHLLAHLEHLALDRNFICSKVTISKETPLYDLGKVFMSAMDNGRMRDRSGRLIEELGLTLKPDSEEYAAFFHWANVTASSGQISQMFPGSLMVHERSGDLELNAEIESFWAGEKIKISRVRDGLRQIGQLQNFSFYSPKASDLPPQRLRFAIELIKSAGYKGWVVLLDEIELIESYSILQRGRSYAELARWLGQAASTTAPGLVVVGTVTDDFASFAISPGGGGKRDSIHMVQRLRASGRYGNIADDAETGMRLLEQQCQPLSSPSIDDVNNTIEKLRALYKDAYDWDAPPTNTTESGASIFRRMRYQVRRAINEWDLLRLRPNSTPDTVIDEFTPAYEENGDLESSDDESGSA